MDFASTYDDPQQEDLDIQAWASAPLAHDLRTLLTTMAGSLAGLRSRLPDESADADYTRLATTLASAERLTGELIGDSRSQVERHPVDINTLVEDLQVTLQRVVGPSRALRIRPATIPAAVVSHPAELERILINLAMNAVEASAETGEVTIEIGLLHLVDGGRGELGTQTRHHVRLTVADTGCGIDPEIVPRIFEPYFSTRPERSGLGLARVASIVRGLNGWLLVESQPGAGTRVHVCLPAV